MKRRINIKESLNISEKMEANVIRAVDKAEHQMQKDKDSLKLMKKIENKKMNMNEIEDKKRLDKLIDYGLVNRLLNKEVVVSGIGLQVLRDLENKKLSIKRV
jgi:hypothetical protein